jgi:hypothetical protein
MDIKEIAKAKYGQAYASQVENKFLSAFVRAVKPTTKDYCGATCCS